MIDKLKVSLTLFFIFCFIIIGSIFLGIVFALPTQTDDTIEEQTQKHIEYTVDFAQLVSRASLGLEERKPDYDLNKDGKITVEDAHLAFKKTGNFQNRLDIKLETTTEKETTTEIIETTTIRIVELTTKIEAEENTTILIKEEPTRIEETEEIEEITTSSSNKSNLLSSCSFSESQLANGLYSNLKQYAWAFLEAERQYSINAVFLAAIAALESGWGTSYLAENNNNFFGWRGSSGFMHFSDPTEGIYHVARSLKNNYLTPGGSCFRGYEVEDVQKCYCPGGDWARQVRGIMNTIYNNSY